MKEEIKKEIERLENWIRDLSWRIYDLEPYIKTIKYNCLRCGNKWESKKKKNDCHDFKCPHCESSSMFDVSSIGAKPIKEKGK